MKYRKEKEFLNSYAKYSKEILIPYRKEVKDYLSSFRNSEHWSEYSTNRLPNPSPIHRVVSRVKRPESVLDKVYRLNGNFKSTDLTQEHYLGMADTLGARIITFFVSGLSLVHAEIIKDPNLEISKEHPPVAYLDKETLENLGLEALGQKKKESGYYSIHYTLRLKGSDISSDSIPWFELQVRTLAMDIWAEIEHQLGYKPDKHTSLAVKKQFNLISQQLRTIDAHFNFLNDELVRFQKEVEISTSDKLNAENLPAVLSAAGITISQYEINGLLKLLWSRGIKIVRELNGILTNDNLELINNTYRGQKSRSATSFELVANVANLKGVRRAEKHDKILNWMEFLDTWLDIQSEDR